MNFNELLIYLDALFDKKVPTQCVQAQYNLCRKEIHLLTTRDLYSESTLKICSSLTSDDVHNPHESLSSYNSNHYVALRNTSRDICILKCINYHASDNELMDRLCHQVHELFVFTQLVRLLNARAYTPVLPHVLGWSWNTQITNIDTNMKQHVTPVLLMETIFPHMTLLSWIRSNYYTCEHAQTMFTHLLLTLMVLNEHVGFVHHDLQLRKILLQPFDSFYTKWKYHPAIVDGDCIKYDSMRGGAYIVPIGVSCPRLTNCSLATIRTNDQHHDSFEYLRIIQPMQTFSHWFMDVSQMIGEWMWATCLPALEHTGTPCIPNRWVTDFAHRIHRHMRLYVTHAPDQQHFFMDHIMFQWFYPYFITHYRQRTLDALCNTFNWCNDVLWHEIIGNIVMLHECLIDVSLTTTDKATYLPRAFHSLDLVNYFYLPTFEVFFHMEELYLKAQIDHEGLTALPLLHRWVKHMNDTRPVANVKRFIGCAGNDNALTVYQRLGLT